MEPQLTDEVITKFESHVLSHSSLAVGNFILTAHINPIRDYGHFCAVASFIYLKKRTLFFRVAFPVL